VTSLIFSNSTAATLYWLTFAAWGVLDMHLVVAGVRGTDTHDRQDATDARTRSVRLGIVKIWVGIGVGFVAAGATSLTLPWPWAFLAAGLALAWGGLGLRWWAKHTLGRFFVAALAVQEDHRVVTSGPYAAVRHPGYAGMVLSLLGFGLATANPLSALPMFGVALYVFVRRIPVEERFLLDSFGQEYREYQRSTARLIPNLW
jgi:protein-S-isoprenylcysteine O-methyltransferase Ste14